LPQHLFALLVLREKNLFHNKDLILYAAFYQNQSALLTLVANGTE